ncbi:hypothetical protein P692DRAFT_201850001 [Suillus brevipes Sb2]|nr:hypothetical protein P692DRAFT_201850001 [Suillus brevipes Sb2]
MNGNRINGKREKKTETEREWENGGNGKQERDGEGRETGKQENRQNRCNWQDEKSVGSGFPAVSEVVYKDIRYSDFRHSRSNTREGHGTSEEDFVPLISKFSELANKVRRNWDGLLETPSCNAANRVCRFVVARTLTRAQPSSHCVSHCGYVSRGLSQSKNKISLRCLRGRVFPLLWFLISTSS